MSSSDNKSSTKETAKQLNLLLKPCKDERADAIRLDDLRRLFSQQDMTPPTSDNTSSSSDAIQKWKLFLNQALQKMVVQLMERMKYRQTAVRTFWGILAACPAYSKCHQYPFVSLELLVKWVQSLPPHLDKSWQTMVESEFFHQYIDIQYYAYIVLTQLATDQYNRNRNDSDAAGVLYRLLMLLPQLKSQQQIDTGSFFISPPINGTPELEDDPSDDEDDDEEEEGSEDDDDDDASSSDNESEMQSPSTKRARTQTETSQIIRIFPFQHLRAHYKVMARAWFAILKLRLSTPHLHHALQTLPTNVLPLIPNPLRFSEFFVQAYDTKDSGVIPVLALDGLFFLILEQGLEYPNFYSSLYRILQPSMFHVKYRSRFLDLLIKCLTKNDMLPAHIVAAFVKRLLRAALTAPPSGCLVTLALTSNLLRKHPECACLIHRNQGREDTSVNDVYDAETDDPTLCRALESSLWELEALSAHYYPAVATLAQSIGREKEDAPFYEMSDFMAHTYKSLFDQERKRLEKKRKKVPLTFHKPKGLFVENDIFQGLLNLSETDEETS
jgi:U3 small nucleolar RNA-associated protein 19